MSPIMITYEPPFFPTVTQTDHNLRFETHANHNFQVQHLHGLDGRKVRCGVEAERRASIPDGSTLDTNTNTTYPPQ